MAATKIPRHRPRHRPPYTIYMRCHGKQTNKNRSRGPQCSIRDSRPCIHACMHTASCIQHHAYSIMHPVILSLSLFTFPPAVSHTFPPAVSQPTPTPTPTPAPHPSQKNKKMPGSPGALVVEGTSVFVVCAACRRIDGLATMGPQSPGHGSGRMSMNRFRTYLPVLYM